MSGHIVGRKRKWPWVVLCALFALAVVWSFAGDVGSILRIVSAVGLGLCLLRLLLLSVSSRRLRRAQEDGGQEFDEEGLPPAPEDDEQWPGDERAEIDPEGQPPAEKSSEEEASTSEDGGQAPDAGVDEDVDQDEALDADGGSEEHLRRVREEFRARAEEAALRVKQREAELHEAASVADQER